MKKIFVINYSLMNKIADKKNGVTGEDAAAYMTGVEIFFLALIFEFLIIRLLPFKVDLVIILGVMGVIWCYTHYRMRKILKEKMIEMNIRNTYLSTTMSRRRYYPFLSIFIFFLCFLLFFSFGVFLIGGYLKN